MTRVPSLSLSQDLSQPTRTPLPRTLTVFLLHWPGVRASRILKIQRSEMSWVVWREQALLPALRSMGFSEVPIVEFTQDNLPGCAHTFMTMPRCPQVPLDEVYRAYPDRAVDLIERLGAFLR